MNACQLQPGHGGAAGDGVRSLERGLTLLRAINADPSRTVSEWGRQIGVPRSTVYRLLETLRALGYIEPSASVRLSEQVRRLSDGFVDERWIELVEREMVRAGRTLFWPLSLFTFAASTMVIRRTTHAQSSMSIDDGMSGRRMPLIETAAGRAYLSHCPGAERDWLLSLATVVSRSTPPIDRERINAHIAAARADGFGRRSGGVMPRTSSLSVPIMRDSRVLGCISIVWIGSALTMAQAMRDLVPQMKALVRRVENRLPDAESHPADAPSTAIGDRKRARYEGSHEPASPVPCA